MSKLDGQNEILIKFLRHLPKHYIHKNYMILDVGGSKSVANQIVQTVQYSPFVQWPDFSSQILNTVIDKRKCNIGKTKHERLHINS